MRIFTEFVEHTNLTTKTVEKIGPNTSCGGYFDFHKDSHNRQYVVCTSATTIADVVPPRLTNYLRTTNKLLIIYYQQQNPRL